MYKYKVVTTKHLQPRQYHYVYNTDKGKWERITGYDFVLATAGEDCIATKVSDNETVYMVHSKGVTLTQSKPSEDITTLNEATVAKDTDNAQYELPFVGFYQSIHAEKAYDEMEYALQEKSETITDEQHDDFWRIFHSEFNYKRYFQSLASLYAHFIIHRLDRQANPIIKEVQLDQPTSYNFTSDTITVTLAEPLPEMNLDYFTVNGLMYDTLALIKRKYTSRDGYISPYEPTPPTPQSVFTEPAYLDCAFEIYIYHKLELDYNDDSPPYHHTKGKLDVDFTDYLHDSGWYCDLFWDCLPKDLADYLSSDTP